MAKLYCDKCGHPTIYEINKPVFCSECGHRFGSAISAAKNKKPKPRVPLYEDDDDEEEDGDNELLGDINNLDDDQLERLSNSIIVEMDAPPQRATVGQIVKEGIDNGRPVGGMKKPKPTKINKKKFMEEWQKKNGSRVAGAKTKTVGRSKE